MIQGSGKEVKADVVGGTVGDIGEGLSGLRGNIVECDVFQVSGTGVDVGG